MTNIDASQFDIYRYIIKAVAESPNKIAVKFDDGSEGVVIFKDSFFNGVFEYLKDPVEFAKVTFDEGALTWDHNDMLELDPAHMHYYIKKDGVFCLL